MALKVEKYINTILKSNSYVFYFEEGDDVWIVDPGDSKEIIRFLRTRQPRTVYVLLTHCHFDHIYGINEICLVWPKTIIVCTLKILEGLNSEKLNGSRYHDVEYTVAHDRFEIINEESVISKEFPNGVIINFHKTPGHSDDSITIEVGGYLFTGDALIPDFTVVTRFKTGNYNEAYESVKYIFKNFENNTYINPGHGNSHFLEELAFDKTKIYLKKESE